MNKTQNSSHEKIGWGVATAVFFRMIDNPITSAVYLEKFRTKAQLNQCKLQLSWTSILNFSWYTAPVIGLSASACDYFKDRKFCE